MPKTVRILALPQAYGASLMGLVDILEVANMVACDLWRVDEKPFALEVVTLDGKPVQCSNGLSVHGNGKLTLPAPAKAGEPFKPEILMVAVPLMTSAEHLNNLRGIWGKEIEWLQNYHHYYSQISTHCNGTFILAEAGLLDGQEATTSWWLARTFRKRYPKVHLNVDKRVVDSGRFLLGGSTSCHRELMMHFVHQHCGAEVSRLLSRYFLVTPGRAGQMVYATDAPLRSSNPVINRAQQWIVKNLEENISVAEVADHAAVTTRTLVRHFQKDFGHSPQAHIQKLRIEKSKALLETTGLKLADIARRCGYSDEGAFRRIFKKHCEVSPKEFRKMFAPA